ncbi:MAG: hypothetical protein JWN02_2676 [Acidobacteria bacterium]|nr:hypothetical protein [Acidobacteriota bacterium]
MVEPTNPGLIATYGYDPFDHLVNVTLQNKVNSAEKQTRSFVYDGRGLLSAESHPEYGTTSYDEYDAHGHLLRKHLGAACSSSPCSDFDLRYVYDGAERLTLVGRSALQAGALDGTRLWKELTYATDNAPSGCTSAPCQWQRGKLLTSRRHNYDANGADTVVQEELQYGGRGGRPSYRRTFVPTQSFATSFIWNELGNVEQILYPDCLSCGLGTPRTVPFGYAKGVMTIIGGFSNQISYYPNGMFNTLPHANGVYEAQSPGAHNMARPDAIAAWNASQYLFATGTYQYDGAGNIATIGSNAYVYDLLSRLTSGGVQSGSRSQSYTFDVFGNMTSVTTPGGSPASVPIAVDSATNHLVGAGYDLAGNMTQYAGNSYRYDPMNMLTWTDRAAGRSLLPLHRRRGALRLDLADLAHRLHRPGSRQQDPHHLHPRRRRELVTQGLHLPRRRPPLRLRLHGRYLPLPPRPPRHPARGDQRRRQHGGEPRLLPLRPGSHLHHPAACREDAVHRPRARQVHHRRQRRLPRLHARPLLRVRVGTVYVP